jgi:GTP:adenosylcobinamide-phosphate guanylyltransferase
MTGSYRAVVLAGERSSVKGLAARFDVPASVLVQVAGESCLARVARCVSQSDCVHGGVLVGPATLGMLPELESSLLREAGLTWQAPATSPAASALQGAESLAHMPILITTADHALLRSATVDAFCEAVTRRADRADFFVGLVDYACVQAEFPQSRRTRLHFADGDRCGSNLFAVTSVAGLRALEFWRALENARKRPWRIASALGAGTLARYVSKRLTTADAMCSLTARAGCRIDWVDVDDARGAIDVDAYGDWLLAEQILRNDAQAH